MKNTFDSIFGVIDNMHITKVLEKPISSVDVVLDTDACNEIDDQYAIAYLINSNEKLNLKAIYAAPFLNSDVKSALEGMEKSYDEVLKILELMSKTELNNILFYGSREFQSGELKPVYSDAACDLASRAMLYDKDNPLYVIAIGAITNVSSALLINPAIREQIVVIWLGGCAHNWPSNREFNLRQDIAGARVLFGSGVPIVQAPAHGVVSSFTASGPELSRWLQGKNRLCDYLLENTIRKAEASQPSPAWTRAIWDVVPIAWLLDGEYMLDYLTPSPIPEYDNSYSFDSSRHSIRYIYHIKRDNLMFDLFSKLAK